MKRLAVQQLMANTAAIGKVWSHQPPQHHAQVYESEQKAIIDLVLWMGTQAAFNASAQANEMDLGTTADTRLINAGHRREGIEGAGRQVPLAGCHCGLLSISPSQQCDELLLLEVPVVRQCVGDAVVRHREERDAIDEAVALVLPVLVENESSVEGGTRLRNDVDPRILADAFNNLYGLLAAPVCPLAEVVKHLAQHFIGRVHLRVRDLLLHRERSGLELIVPIDERDPVAGIGEHSVHRVVFGAPYK